MAVEIEHKYLVHRNLWKPKDSGVLYRQGYLSSVKERVVRVRIAANRAYLTVKGLTTRVSAGVRICDSDGRRGNHPRSALRASAD
jgi:adenylate cyclase